MQSLTIARVATVVVVVVAAVGSCRRDPPRPGEVQAPAPPAAAAPSVTFAPAADAASPTSVALRQIRTFGGANGQLWAFMEIVNQTDQPMVPDIRFHYRDGSGQAVSQGKGVEVCPIAALVMRPREKISCLTKVPPAAATATYDITLHNANAEELARDKRTDLEVVGAELSSAGQMTGFVENRTAFTLSGSWVQALFYDAAGNIVGHGDARVKGGPIKPGARAPFQLSAGFMLAPAASFSARAWTIGGRK
jgi:hypothetical protein